MNNEAKNAKKNEKFEDQLSARLEARNEARLNPFKAKQEELLERLACPFPGFENGSCQILPATNESENLVVFFHFNEVGSRNYFFWDVQFRNENATSAGLCFFRFGNGVNVETGNPNLAELEALLPTVEAFAKENKFFKA